MNIISFVPSETPISQWFNRKFVEWQASQGKKKTIAAFAEYCGIKQNDMSRYLSGASKPDGDNLQKVGIVLGDEIYDLLGRPRPDARLQALIAHWGNIPDVVKGRIGEIVERSVQRGAIVEIGEDMAQPKRGRQG